MPVGWFEIGSTSGSSANFSDLSDQTSSTGWGGLYCDPECARWINTGAATDDLLIGESGTFSFTTPVLPIILSYGAVYDSGYAIGLGGDLAAPGSSAVTPVVMVTPFTEAVENVAAGTLRFTRVGDTTGPLTVVYTVRQGNPDMATPGTDYTTLDGSVTFEEGQATADVLVSTINDTTPEFAEFVTIDLASGTGYQVGALRTATVRIDDPDMDGVTVVGVLESVDTAEGEDPGWFRLGRGGDLTNSLTVDYTLGGDATSLDYTVSGTLGEVTFAAGEAEAFVFISRVLGRPAADGSTLTLMLAADPGYMVAEAIGRMFLIAAPPAGTASVTVTATNQHFKVTEAESLALTNSTFNINVDGQMVPVTVAAYRGGKLDIQLVADEDVQFPASGGALSLVATTGNQAVMENLHWVQFVKLRHELEPGEADEVRRSTKRSLGRRKLFYFAADEWIVDSPSSSTPYYKAPAAALRGANGASHSLAMQDRPGFTGLAKFKSEEFIARTYLLYENTIVYSVGWSIKVTKGANNKWQMPSVVIDFSGEGETGSFPNSRLYKLSGDWLWMYEDLARTKRVDTYNPLLLPP